LIGLALADANGEAFFGLPHVGDVERGEARCSREVKDPIGIVMLCERR
jgi:hypothetical protein